MCALKTHHGAVLKGVCVCVCVCGCVGVGEWVGQEARSPDGKTAPLVVQ